MNQSSDDVYCISFVAYCRRQSPRTISACSQLVSGSAPHSAAGLHSRVVSLISGFSVILFSLLLLLAWLTLSSEAGLVVM